MTLTLHDVVKHYPAGGEIVRAVDGVNLTVAAGEMAALYGPSGSGKTTLLMLAGTLLTPDRGTITFGGCDLSTLSPAEAADFRLHDVGVIFQDYQLMRGVSTIENAAVKLLADPISLATARKRVAPMLRRVGLGHRLNAIPEELSGGERQRVAVARALANQPRLILADEPTANLDTRRGRNVLELLRAISHESGATVLLVTHDVRAARIADRVYTLRDGILLETDPLFVPQLEATFPSDGGG